MSRFDRRAYLEQLVDKMIARGEVPTAYRSVAIRELDRQLRQQIRDKTARLVNLASGLVVARRAALRDAS
jgi:hypothetical protein